MNSFDLYYNFRLATVDDVDAIQQFFKDGWGRYNVVASDRDFLLWMYGRQEYGDNQNVNFVIMETKMGEIAGCIGYVPYSNDKQNLQISPAMMKRQMQIVGEKAHFSFGTNPDTIKPIYEKVFHHETGVIQQFYMLNPDIDEYKIADIKDRIIHKPVKSDLMLTELYDFKEIELWIGENKRIDRLPYKSTEYIKKRYFNHPVYSYRKWVVNGKSGEQKGILFGRVNELFGRRILRIVDYRGDVDSIRYLGEPLLLIMKRENFEYIDWIAITLSKELMKEAGFELLKYEGENIIPNYFEPYVRKNIKLYYQKDKDIIIFKADGDQDRPNRIEK